LPLIINARVKPARTSKRYDFLGAANAQYPLMPAKAGIQPFFLHWFFINWIPAYAGMSGEMLRN